MFVPSTTELVQFFFFLTIRYQRVINRRHSTLAWAAMEKYLLSISAIFIVNTFTHLSERIKSDASFLSSNRAVMFVMAIFDRVRHRGPVVPGKHI